MQELVVLRSAWPMVCEIGAPLSMAWVAWCAERALARALGVVAEASGMACE